MIKRYEIDEVRDTPFGVYEMKFKEVTKDDFDMRLGRYVREMVENGDISQIRFKNDGDGRIVSEPVEEYRDEHLELMELEIREVGENYDANDSRVGQDVENVLKMLQDDGIIERLRRDGKWNTFTYMGVEFKETYDSGRGEAIVTTESDNEYAKGCLAMTIREWYGRSHEKENLQWYVEIHGKKDMFFYIPYKSVAQLLHK